MSRLRGSLVYLAQEVQRGHRELVFREKRYVQIVYSCRNINHFNLIMPGVVYYRATRV